MSSQDRAQGKVSSPAVKAARERTEPAEGTTGRSRPAKGAPGGVTIDLKVPIADVTPEGERVAEHLPRAWLNDLLGATEGDETGWWASQDGDVQLRLSGENPAMFRLRGEGRDVNHKLLGRSRGAEPDGQNKSQSLRILWATKANWKICLGPQIYKD